MSAADVERVGMMGLTDVERVALAMLKAIEENGELEPISIATAAMRETRLIDAEALLVEAQTARDNLYVEASNELRGVANWLKGRADEQS